MSFLIIVSEYIGNIKVVIEDELKINLECAYNKREWTSDDLIQLRLIADHIFDVCDKKKTDSTFQTSLSKDGSIRLARIVNTPYDVMRKLRCGY